MSEGLSNTLYGVSFFVSLFIVGDLWWLTAKPTEWRRFWGLLAMAGTLSLVADFTWGIIYLVDPDLWLDWIDYLYVARYLLVFLAFWLYPQLWQWRQWVAMLAAILWAWVLLWLIVILPSEHPDPAYVWAGMIFPVFDVGILYAVVFRWHTSQAAMKPILLKLSLALLAYGAANWFNYSARVINPKADSIAALILWLLSNVFVGVAIWYSFKRQE